MTSTPKDVGEKNKWRSQEPKSQWHHLPVEIVQRIFELAATSTSTALVLSLVSRTVLEWTLPVLYRTIVIRDHRDLANFKAAIGSRARKKCYHHTIRNLYLPKEMRLFIPQEFLSLEHLAFSPFSPGDYSSLPPFPSLTHLTVYEPRECIFLHLPSFQSITHLYIASRDKITHHVPGIVTHASIPNLTHFVCHIFTTVSPWIDEGLRKLLTWFHGFEKLRVVGLAPMTFDQTRGFEPDTSIQIGSLLRRIEHEGHPKMVLIHLDFDVTVWENWCHGQENVWELAERLLLEQSMLEPRLERLTVKHQSDT
ncbi:hypothetical protein JB92DRAFT_2957594 [Gautieria morchelliformis]|nr:hypothetical protein JB92DRAFT_2957594 [Gautieria morchelliformis]